MVHSKKRSRGCGEEKDGESSDQAKRRREMRLQGADDVEFLQWLRKKMKAVARRALRKRLADSSGVSNLVQEQVESLLQEQVGRFVPNSEPINLVQEQVERLVQEHVRRSFFSSRVSNLIQEQVEKLVQEQVEKRVQEQVGRFVPNSEPTNLMQAQVERIHVQEQTGRLIPNSEPTNPRLEVAAGQSETWSPAILSNSGGRYRLQFQNDIPEVLHTCNKVKLEDNKDVEIAIFDTALGSIATSSPWSSAMVRVVVLDAEEWQANETYVEHIVKPRDGKGPLLLGDVVELKQGVGRLTGLTFTDISGPTRSGKFRLGLRLLRNGEGGAYVGDGLSKPFRVMDRRVKGGFSWLARNPFVYSNEKHHPPELTDEVHHLDNIRKNGPIHNRLADGGISTVQQLLQAYKTDPKKLRRLIGGERAVAQGTWDAIIKHASEWRRRPGDELHFYDLTEQASVQNLNPEDNIRSYNPPTLGSNPNPLHQALPSSADQHPSTSLQLEQIMQTDKQFSPELPYAWDQDIFDDLIDIELLPELTSCLETSYTTDLAVAPMNHPIIQEEETNITMFFVIRRRWVKLKSVTLIARYLAIKRSGKSSSSDVR